MLADDLRIARAAAAAAESLPGVAGLARGEFAEIATYGPPGETVRGVVVRRDAGALSVEVHLIALYPNWVNLVELADRVRGAVRQALEAPGLAGAVRYVDIVVDDLLVEGS